MAKIDTMPFFPCAFPSDNHSPIRFFKGFTLAEVLITLGIIGVVATITMPTVINKVNEYHWQVSYKKAFSLINQALLKMQQNDEMLPLTAIINTGGETVSANIGENFKTLTKYIKTAKTCFENNADECLVCDEGQAASPTSSAPDWLGCRKQSYAFVDASGMVWFLYGNREYPLLIDVNGDKVPNRLGKDRFVMLFSSNDSKDKYGIMPNRVIPHKDFKTKERWCPSGKCLYTTWLLK